MENQTSAGSPRDSYNATTLLDKSFDGINYAMLWVARVAMYVKMKVRLAEYELILRVNYIHLFLDPHDCAISITRRLRKDNQIHIGGISEAGVIRRYIPQAADNILCVLKRVAISIVSSIIVYSSTGFSLQMPQAGIFLETTI